ncbi:MAG: DUF4179 domain-containing protein [Parasporobacterium sp.]|nr:DUF4179 domain-containing protein [Parasporobacterium sp.]
MTDNRLDEILNAALAPEISDEDIRLVRRRRPSKIMKIKRRILTAAASIAAAAVLGIGALGAINPVLASKIPLIGNIFLQTEDKLSYSGEFADKATVLENGSETYTAENNGIKVTASEVYSDGYSIYLAMAIEGREWDLSNMAYPGYMYVNMEWQVEGSSNSDADTSLILEGNLEDNTVGGVVKLDLNNSAPDGVTGDTVAVITIHGIGYDDARSEYQEYTGASFWTDGEWKFDIPLHIDENASYTVNSGKESSGMALDRVVVTPYQVIVYAYRQAPEIVVSSIDEIDPYTVECLREMYPDADDDTLCSIYADYQNSITGKAAPVVAFDKDGNKLQMLAESVTGNARFAVDGQDVSTVHVFVLPDDETWFDVYKFGGGMDAAKDAAVIAEEIHR